MEPILIKVSGNSPMMKVAEVIAHTIRNGQRVEVRTVGKNALFIASKAIAASVRMLRQEGYIVNGYPEIEIAPVGERKGYIILFNVSGYLPRNPVPSSN